MKKLQAMDYWLRLFSSRAARPLHSAAMSDLLENEARRSVLMTLLRGTTIMTGLFVLLLLVSIFMLGNTFVWLRAVMGALALAYLVAALFFAARARQRLPAYMLVIFYVVSANFSAAMWGVGEPFALLMMIVTIVLAGFLLGSRFSLYVATLQAVLLITLQQLVERDAIFWTHGVKPVLLGEVVGYALLFMVMGLVTWLFGRQVEQSLRRAWQAERDLQAERDQLEVRLQERTESLRALQLEEMKQLYRFAELGQMSTALLHDLANRLTTLTLDIEDLGGKQRTGAIERARQSIGYLDELVGKVSSQLHEHRESEPFNVLESLHETKTNLHARLQKSGVKLMINREDAAPSRLVGDALRFGQVMTILLGNAIDAAAEPGRDKRVEVTVQSASRHIEILVRDWGKGIAQTDQAKLFTPFYTTKDDGMGIGLFIAREIMKTHFKGSVTLDHTAQPTTFRVIVPHGGDGHDGQKEPKRAKDKRKPTK